MQSKGGLVKTGSISCSREMTHTSGTRKVCGSTNALVRQDADIPFTLVLPQPRYQRALQIAVIIFTHVPFNQPSVEHFLVRTVAGAQVFAHRNQCCSCHRRPPSLSRKARYCCLAAALVRSSLWCRTSMPFTRNSTSSAMFVEWSAMRSRLRTTESR